MKFEKRNVYIKEFWTMSYMDRLAYRVVNALSGIEFPEINPLKMSIHSVYRWLMLVGYLLFLLVLAPYDAHSLKSKPMPESKDPALKGGDDWFIENQWVVKRNV